MGKAGEGYGWSWAWMAAGLFFMLTETGFWAVLAALAISTIHSARADVIRAINRRED